MFATSHSSQGRSPRTQRVIGRDRERALLREHLHEALAGHGSLILIGGEAGIGKTTMVATLAQEARSHRALVLPGGCYDLTTTPAYGPWIEITRAYPDDANLPPLPDHLSVSGTINVDSQTAFFDLFMRFLLHVADNCPLVLVLEDLHWADPGSLELLRHAARVVHNHSILVIATYRDDEGIQNHPLSRVLPTLVREGRSHRLALQRLDRAATHSLVREHCRLSRPDEERLVDYLDASAEGNPFFITELLHTLGEQHLLMPSGGSWYLGDLTSARIPVLIHQLTTARLAQLTSESRTLLDLAAIAGHEASLDLLKELFPGTVTDLDSALQQALHWHLLHLQPEQQTVRFDHALIRQTIYEDVPPLKRQRVHRQIGELLAQRTRPEPDAVADHLYQAGDARAVDWLVLAAERAHLLFAPESVITRCKQIHMLAGRLGMMPPIAVYRLQGLAQEMIGDLDGAGEAHEMALALGNAQGDHHAAWRAWLDLGSLWAARDYGEAKAFLEQALELARTIADPATLAQSLNRLGNWYVNVEQPAAGLHYHQQALDIFERAGDVGGIAATLDLMGLTYLISGDEIRSSEYYSRAIPLLRRLGDRQTLVTALVASSAARYGTSHSLAGAIRQHCTAGVQRDRFMAFEEATGIAREIGWRAGEAFSLALSAQAAQRFGDYHRAIEDGQEAIRIARGIGHRQWQILGLCSLGAAYADLFAFDLALKYLEHAHHLALETNSQFMIGTSTSFLASACVACNRLDFAEQLIDPLVNSRPPEATMKQRGQGYVSAEINLARGDVKSALAILDQIEAAMPSIAGQRAPQLLLLRARVLMASKCYPEAKSLLEEARQSAHAFDYRPLLWRVLASLASLCLRQGQWQEAEATRRAALSIIADLASGVTDEGLRERFLTGARAQLPEQLPFRPDRTTVLIPGGLTAREQEVLTLIAEGLTDAEAGERLFISPRTVSQHLRSIYSKLDVGNRTAAVRAAIDRDLI